MLPGPAVGDAGVIAGVWDPAGAALAAGRGALSPEVQTRDQKGANSGKSGARQGEDLPLLHLSGTSYFNDVQLF